MKILLRALAVLVAMSCASSVQADDRFYENFERGDTLSAWSKISGSWDTYFGYLGLHGVSGFDKPAMITLKAVTAASLDVTLGRPDRLDRDGRLLLVIGDPDGQGTSPSYYIYYSFSFDGTPSGSTVRERVAVGQVMRGFLASGQLNAPICFSDTPKSPNWKRPVNVVLEDGFLRVPRFDCSIDVGTNPPRGIVSIGVQTGSEMLAFMGVSEIEVNASGRSVTRNHPHLPTRRMLRRLMGIGR